eukprot:5866577-Pyramimonas_sp.AAC.1
MPRLPVKLSGPWGTDFGFKQKSMYVSSFGVAGGNLVDGLPPAPSSDAQAGLLAREITTEVLHNFGRLKII